MGLGLGILHAQITAYDPQGLGRTSPSRPVLGPTSTSESVDIPEPSRLGKPLTEAVSSVTKNIPQTESNASNHIGVLSQTRLSLDASAANSGLRDNLDPNSSLYPNSDNKFNQSDDLPEGSRYGLFSMQCYSAPRLHFLSWPLLC